MLPPCFLPYFPLWPSESLSFPHPSFFFFLFFDRRALFFFGKVQVDTCSNPFPLVSSFALATFPDQFCPRRSFSSVSRILPFYDGWEIARFAPFFLALRRVFFFPFWCRFPTRRTNYEASLSLFSRGFFSPPAPVTLTSGSALEVLTFNPQQSYNLHTILIFSPDKRVFPPPSHTEQESP